MICLPATGSISEEARALMASRPYFQEGMRQLAALLPEDDAELYDWLSGAYDAHDEDSFTMLWAAAGMAGRQLSATLIRPAIMMRISDWHVAWLAWRMEGNVSEEFLAALGSVPQAPERYTLFLLMAIVWWQKHRAEQEIPREIQHFATLMSKQKKLPPHAVVYLTNIAIIVGGGAQLARGVSQAGQSLTQKAQEEQIAKFYALLEGPFDSFMNVERSRDYTGHGPKRRAVKKIRRNALCPCASGKKYKECCIGKDDARLSQSSSVAGLTTHEVYQPETGPITEHRLELMGPAALAKLDPSRVPRDLQENFIVTLSLIQLYPEAIAALRSYSEVRETGLSLPDHLHQVWSGMFGKLGGYWRPDLARQLVEIFPDAEEKLGEKTHAGVRVLLVGDDPAKVLETVEAELRAMLESGDPEQLCFLAGYLVHSPYRALGICLARSFLPIATDDEKATYLFDAILDARARLNLSPDDEFSDFMDQRALKKARRHQSNATAEQEEKLERVGEENRAIKEEVAQLKRNLTLVTQQQRRQQASEPLAPDLKLQEEVRQLQTKIKGTEAFAAEKAKEARTVRRELEKTTREMEELRAAQKSNDPDHDQPADQADEDLKVAGNQPVRLIDFPKDFDKRLAEFPLHARRAVMKRIGLIAAGDQAGFDKVKQLKACPGVLRARVSDKFRLFFVLTPDRVRIVDLIWRDDLDRWIKQLLARGVQM